MSIRTEYLRTNNKALAITLSNYTYNTGDKLEIIVKQAGYSGNWPIIISTPGNSSSTKLRLQYNTYSNRSVINVTRNGSYSGDSNVSYTSITDYDNYYKYVLDSNTFTVLSGTSLSDISTVKGTGTIGDTTATQTSDIPVLYATISNNYCDNYFYQLTITRSDVIIHDYVPIQNGGVLDLITTDEYYTTATGYIDGPTLQDTYTVAYNANGGTGTVNPQNIAVDVETALNANTFTRENYLFTGWATSTTSPVVYQDEEIVLNIAEADETITLYAVWQKAPISISLQTNMSEPNKIDKTITTISTVSGVLRSECSIVDPVIIFELDLADFVECNYITIPAFRRSYFVTNIRSIRNGLVEMSCHVDVLSSFKTEIRSNSAIIHKSENNWNLYLNDGSLKTYQNASIFTHSFPAGFAGQSFVLALAGE